MKLLVSTLAFLVSAPAFAAPLQIRCDYPGSPTSYLEFTESDERSMVLKMVINGRESEPYRSYYKYKQIGGRIGGSEEYHFDLHISGASVTVTFEKGVEGTGLWKKGFGHSGVKMECARNQAPNRI